MSARWDGYPSAGEPGDLGWRLCLQVPVSVDKVDYPGISPTFRGALGGPGQYSAVKKVLVCNPLNFSAPLQAITGGLLNFLCATCIMQSQRCCLRLAAHSTPAATATLAPCTIL